MIMLQVIVSAGTRCLGNLAGHPGARTHATLALLTRCLGLEGNDGADFRPGKQRRSVEDPCTAPLFVSPGDCNHD